MAKKQLPPQTIEKYLKVWNARVAGLTFDEIAKLLDYADRSGAKRAFDAAAERYETESVEQQRVVQNERLDHLWKRIMTRLDSGDLSVADTALRIEKRRAELWGLDAPRRTEITGKDGDAIEVDFVSDLLAKIDDMEQASEAADPVG